MSTGSTREYTQEEVRLALQLLGEPVEPSILRRDRSPEAIALGEAPLERYCSGCGGTRETGELAIDPARGTPYCRACRRKYAKYSIPSEMLHDAARSVAARRRMQLSAAAARGGAAGG